VPPIPFAIVGIGGYGRSHLRALTDLESEGVLRLAAAVVIDPENHPEQLEGFKEKGVIVHANTGDLLKAGGADVVTLPVGIHHHVPLSIAFLEAGFHVYCEKPLTACIQDADRLIVARERSGRLPAVGYQSVSSPTVQKIKALLVNGELGAIRSIHVEGGWPRGDHYYSRNAWAGRLKAGDAWVLDSPMNNAMAHDVNGALYFAGAAQHQAAAPVSVQAELYHAREIETLDTCSLRIQTDTAVEIIIAMSHVTETTFNPTTEIRCEKGSIRWGLGKAEVSGPGGTRDLQTEEKGPTHPSFRNMSAAAEGEAEIFCPPDVARMQTLAINGAHESCPDILPIPTDRVSTVENEDDRFTVVKEMDDLIHQSVAEGKLFSELGVDWAVRTETYDLTDYREFPNKVQER